MTEVFLFTCVNPDDRIRFGLMRACLARWEEDADADIKIVSPPTIGMTPSVAPDFDGKKFKTMSRIWADQHATGPFYITADDDCMPLGSEFVARITQRFLNQPTYALVAARLLPELAGYYDVHDQSSLIMGRLDRTSGGINIQERGLVTKFAAPDMFLDDAKLTQLVRSAGLKVGVFRDIYTNHIGAGLSTTWPEPYTNTTQITEFKL